MLELAKNMPKLWPNNVVILKLLCVYLGLGGQAMNKQSLFTYYQQHITLI